jgi:hypothetical protein
MVQLSAGPQATLPAGNWHAPVARSQLAALHAGSLSVQAAVQHAPP